MLCPGCGGEMIRTRATDFGPEYDYCRTCKKELAEFTLGEVHAELPPIAPELECAGGSLYFGPPHALRDFGGIEAWQYSPQARGIPQDRRISPGYLDFCTNFEHFPT